MKRAVYWELIGKFPQLQPFMPVQHYQEIYGLSLWDKDSWSSDVDESWHLQYQLCEQFKYDFGFCLPTAEVIERMVTIIRNHGGPQARVLDAGSGSGFIAKELCRRGVETIAVDLSDYENHEHKFGYPMIQVHQRDAQGDAVEFVGNGFDVVLLTWPPNEDDMGRSFAFDVAAAMKPGQMLIYEGEDCGGCTGDDAFFKYLLDEHSWFKDQKCTDSLNAVHVKFAQTRVSRILCKRGAC
jgi:hypothetical protein